MLSVGPFLLLDDEDTILELIHNMLPAGYWIPRESSSRGRIPQAHMRRLRWGANVKHRRIQGIQGIPDQQ
jgi:hypothetical protein